MNKFEGQSVHLQPLNKEILVLLQQQKLPKDHISLKILIPQDRPHVLFRLYRQHEPCQIPCPQASFPARHQFQLGRSPIHCWFDLEQNRFPKYPNLNYLLLAHGLGHEVPVLLRGGGHLEDGALVLGVLCKRSPPYRHLCEKKPYWRADGT